MISAVADLFDEAAAVVDEVVVVELLFFGVGRSEMEAHLRYYW